MVFKKDMLIFILLINFLCACVKDGTIEQNLDNGPIYSFPDPPTGLSLSSLLSSSGTDQTPTIIVSGVKNGQNVDIFIDSNCSIKVGSKVASKESISITISTLYFGMYTFYANTTENRRTSDCSTMSVNYTITPFSPTGISLSSPLSSPGLNATPVITVSGVSIGQTVRLFTDSSCINEVGSAIASGTSINIITSSLNMGSYTFYANVIQSGITSNCSSIYVAYKLIPMTPTGLSLISPSSLEDFITTPTITVSGVENGDTVRLFTDSICSEYVGEGVGLGTTADITTISLNPGYYMFYANIVENGVSSNCSTDYISYTVVGCPSGYIPIPANSELDVPMFCVMKYEARAWSDINGDEVVNSNEIDSDGSASTSIYKPGSTVNGIPWRYISQISAFDECNSLNTESAITDISNDVDDNGTYALLTNPEWMAISRNIENVDENWTDGSVGSGCLFRGNISTVIFLCWR